MLLLGHCRLGYGQNQVVIRVVDRLSGEPISSAKVTHLGDSTEATTNSRGFAQLFASVNDSIVLSADSYLTGVVTVPEQATFQASLEIAEEALSFEGGIKNFYEQLGKKLRYPRSARAKGSQRVTFTSFAIAPDGKMTDFRSLTSTHSALDREVARVLSDIKGAWSPAYRGQRMTLPVVFKLESEGRKASQEDVAPEGRLLSEVVVVGYTRVSRY